MTDLVTRNVSTGDAHLSAPDGTALAGVVVTCTIVDSVGNPASVLDATTFHDTSGVTSATTDAQGKLTIKLWPNDRGNIVTQYLVKVAAPNFRDFIASVPSGGTTLTWAMFKAGGTPLTAQDILAYIPRSLATAVNDFVVASGVGVFVKKTLTEVRTILGLGSAAYTASTDYATAARIIDTAAPLSGGGGLSADRTLTTSMATNRLIGRGTAGVGVMEEIILGTGLSFAGNTLNVTVSSALSAITAAASGNTIANGVHAQAWNWALTAAGRAFSLGETVASTDGTSTGGVPNQVLFRLDTLAGSTMSPLSVYSRGAHVFSVSPTTAQILATNGSLGAPAYSFASAPGAGLALVSGILIASTGVGSAAYFTATKFSVPAGTAFDSAITDFTNFGSTGLSWLAANTMSVTDNGQGELLRFGQRFMQGNAALADTVSYAINARKARGTIAAPTVIPTGDNLLTISGWGYVGATNLYQEATRITYGTDGAITDAVGGLGGVMRFLTRLPAGAALVERLTLDNNAAAGLTAMLVSVAGAAPIRVSVGAVDSGGAGFRMLRVPN